MWPLIEQKKPSSLVIDCSSIIDIEYTALKMLAEAEEKLRREGVTLWLAALNPAVWTTVSRSKVGHTMGQERMFSNVQSAVERYEKVTVMQKRSDIDMKTRFREAV
jgi:MFS superfamily sulfate permease-like transporter